VTQSILGLHGLTKINTVTQSSVLADLGMVKQQELGQSNQKELTQRGRSKFHYVFVFKYGGSNEMTVVFAT